MSAAWFSLPLCALVACSQNDSVAPTPAASSAAPQQRTVVFDAKGCEVSPNGIEPDAICVTRLKATIRDDDGNPLPDLVTTACGDGCSFGKTDATGVTDISVKRYMRKPALMLHGRSKYASFYTRLTGEGEIDKGVLTLPRMPLDGVVIPEDGALATIASGDVKITLPAGVMLDIDILELATPDEQKFRALAVPLEKAPPFVEPSMKIVALYAFTPFMTKAEPGLGVTVQNRAKLPNGAAVELFAQGTDLKDRHGPFGGFSKVADGHVSADGSMIETDPGQLIPELTWLGIRLKE